jgi:uncharacterized protein YjbJ (UPF0337 family)
MRFHLARQHPRKRDEGAAMNKDRVKGKSKEIEGRVLRGVGKATGSRKTQAKGAVKQAEASSRGWSGG